jgi:hypothetical protein
MPEWRSPRSKPPENKPEILAERPAENPERKLSRFFAVPAMEHRLALNELS